ncbi:hypothetical protein [Acidovorax sp. BLS4]|uniref:hypothetical protein n=1 Tax=Acidovorax sp. BLS4 TaxID=3273430 RepID=UPI0029423B50|nr:hypothetical protein [Paracidovorax avenae]WOI45628.1 hypothetical protein R1Z03_24875 [Paracidovorax avenae]
MTMALAANSASSAALASSRAVKKMSWAPRNRFQSVSSDSHYRGDLDLTDLNWERRPYKPFAAYGATKLANLLFMAELQRRLTAAGSTLRATGAHPGSTATAITANTGNRFNTTGAGNI